MPKSTEQVMSAIHRERPPSEGPKSRQGSSPPPQRPQEPPPRRLQKRVWDQARGVRLGGCGGLRKGSCLLRGEKPTTPHDRCDWPGELNITSSTLPPAPQGQARLTRDSEMPLLQIPPSSSWGAAVANLEPATSRN